MSFSAAYFKVLAEIFGLNVYTFEKERKSN